MTILKNYIVFLTDLSDLLVVKSPTVSFPTDTSSPCLVLLSGRSPTYLVLERGVLWGATYLPGQREGIGWSPSYLAGRKETGRSPTYLASEVIYLTPLPMKPLTCIIRATWSVIKADWRSVGCEFKPHKSNF